MPNNVQVQELYHQLDHYSNGDRYFAWYAQLRAEEKTHAVALEETIEHFHLRDQPWWQARNTTETEAERQGAMMNVIKRVS